MIVRMRVLSKDKHFFAFGPNLKPAYKVALGEEVVIETLDCFSDQLTNEEQLVTSIDFSKVNPATGPIYVDGVEAGDALRVSIKRIELQGPGIIVTVPGSGALGEVVREAKTRTCKLSDDGVNFKGIKIPYSKMVGVIGVAAKEETPCGTPGKHGGNLDSKVITEGATLYLPVFFKGGLFGLGDLHAVMGDGEVCVAACECRGKVTVEFGVVKGAAPAWPFVELGEHYYILVSNENLELAFKEAIFYGVKALQESNSLLWEDAYMLASMTMDVQVSQLVDPRKTVRVKLSKKYVSLDGLIKAMKAELPKELKGE